MIVRSTLAIPDRLSRVSEVLARFYSVLNAEKRWFVLEGSGRIRLSAERNRKAAWSVVDFSI
jgi:hypothetical protein